jgi:hypothetical protein
MTHNVVLMMNKPRTLVLGFAAIMVSTGLWSPTVSGNDQVTQPGPYSVMYEGPELRASVGYRQAALDLGDEWMILVLQLTAPPQADNVDVFRDRISIRTPNGRRLPVLTQAEYRAIYGKIRTRIRWAVSNTAPLRLRGSEQRPCRQWFLADPSVGFGREEIPISSYQVCAGPIVVKVPGGVQPGRWRLMIELEESTADIPFEIEIGDR